MRVGRRRGPTRTQAWRYRPFAAAILFVVTGAAFFGASVPLRAHDGVISDDPIARLRDYVQHVALQTEAPAVERANLAPSEQARDKRGAEVFADLRTFVQGIRDSAPQPAGDQIKVAADNAFDALREFLQRHNGAPPVEQAPTSPRPPVLAPKAPLADPIVEPPLIVANNVGSSACHGPGSAHVRSVGCAACHGDGGITTRPGIPSLVGLDAQYLVVAMKEYVSGQRKHAMMKALLSGLGDAELNNIAFYYARQPAARAETPLVGNPSKSSTAACAACHGENGIAVSPAFPNLAGQDSQYLADAMRAYKLGARNKVVACAACHGDRGISKTSGTPSLVGMDTQYLVAAMKAYASGQRKNAVMKALLSGVGEAELNNMAIYYAQQAPARAPTPSIGDAAAGKSASAACAGCHGPEGVSANPAWPSLAGQDARYLADATKAYKDGGSRGDPMMKGMVAALDERTINDIAAYYASLAPAPASSAPGTAARREPALVRNNLVAS